MDIDNLTQWARDIPRRQVEFRNGGQVSIQASSAHYSRPRDNFGPYESVEIGFPLDCIVPDSMRQFEEIGGGCDDPDCDNPEADAIYAYVPADVLAEFVEVNGGVFIGELPPIA